MPVQTSPPGFERFSAEIVGRAFAPHRHDTYTFAFTLRGVQAFDYRGETRYSQPGGIVVLHPDELHDGRPVTEDGFTYRAVAIRPDSLFRHSPNRALPFLGGGLSRNPALVRAVAQLFHLPAEATELEVQTAIIELAQALDGLAGDPATAPAFAHECAAHAGALIREHVETGISLERLESLTGLDRWQLCRAFRSVHGTSPARYLVQRRLDRVREGVLDGLGLADAALAAGFADQAHMSRHFKASYGISPGLWRRTIVQDPNPPRPDTGLH